MGKAEKQRDTTTTLFRTVYTVVSRFTGIILA